MNLASKSKRQILRYVKLLRRNLKLKQEIMDQVILNNEKLASSLRVMEDKFLYQDYNWYSRLREAEEMFQLKTTDLKRHNEKLVDMLVHRESLRAPPPIIIKTNEPELKSLRKGLIIESEANAILRIEKENLQFRMDAIERIIAKSS